MKENTFQCRNMGLPMFTSDCIENYNRANTPGVEALWNEANPCFACPQGKEKISARERTVEEIGRILKPQPSRRLCDEDYTKVVEDLKRNYQAGDILVVPDFVKKSETFARLGLATREEFWFKATGRGLVDFLRHNEYEVILKETSIPSLDDLLTRVKPESFSSVSVSVTTTLPPEKTPHVVRILPPEVKPETKAQARAGEKAEREAKKKTTKQTKDAVRRKKRDTKQH